MDWADARVEEQYSAEADEAERLLLDAPNSELIRRHVENDREGLPVGGTFVAISRMISNRLMWHRLTEKELEDAGLDPSQFKPYTDPRR
jgi:hypothetical protein